MNMTNITRALAAVFAVVASSATLQAESLSPAHGRSIDLGGFRGVAYYTVEDGGYRVVVTVMEADGKPVRLETVLGPRQSMLLTSAQGGGAAAKIEITRRDDQLHVNSVALTN
jgi:hypothetical protein